MIPLCQNILDTHFTVLGTFNLNFYSKKMPELYHRLKAIKKSCFDPNDRIVFTLFDHDFYLDNQGPGWTLYNLQLILDNLDISNFFCLLLTNQPNYNDYTKLVQKQLTTDEFPIRSITTLLNPDWLPTNRPPNNKIPAVEKIKKPYCALSRQSRPHRTFFIAKLMSEGLLEDGVVGYNNIPFVDPAKGEPVSNSYSGFPVGSLLVIPDHYQRILLKNKKNKSIYNNFEQHYKQYKNFYEDVDLTDKSQSCRLDIDTPISQGFLYVGLETLVGSCKVHASIISLRGILERRPFVISGCPGILQFMRSRGFKTFGEFWDEGYDDITDFEERVDSIVNIIKHISLLNLEDLKNLYQRMQSIIDYNYNFYHHEFVGQEQKYLENEILNNLKGN